MRGILALLFLCVTLHLAEGYGYGRPHEQDLYREYEPLVYRESESEQDKNNGYNEPVTILGKALLETVVALLDYNSTTQPNEGRRRSNLDSEDSQSWTTKQPGFLNDTDSDLGKILSGYFEEDDLNKGSDGECFVLQILDLIDLIVKNVYDESMRTLGYVPSGPKMLHLLVNELNENIESLSGTEVLDQSLFKLFKLIKLFLSLLESDLTTKYKNSPAMDFVVRKFLTKVESFFVSYIQTSRQMAAAGSNVPIIRLLFDQFEDALEDLAEGKERPNDKTGSSLSDIRKFVSEIRSILQILFWGKGQDSKISLLKEVLLSVRSVLGRVIEDIKLFGTEPGSVDNLILNLLIRIHATLA